MKKLLLAALLPALLGACAGSPDASAPGRGYDDRDYVTGSNLPRRHRQGADNLTTMTAEEFDKARARAPGGAAAGGSGSTGQ